MSVALIGVGGNLGDRATLEHRFLAARRALCTRLAPVLGSRWSRLYWSAPVGPMQSQPRFLNAVLRLELARAWDPVSMLAEFLDIERSLGRRRLPSNAPKGPRAIDLDLLFLDEMRIVSAGPPAVELPHPRAPERAFVLVPLADLMGTEWMMPGFDRTVAACLHEPAVAGQRVAMAEAGNLPI